VVVEITRIAGQQLVRYQSMCDKNQRERMGFKRNTKRYERRKPDWLIHDDVGLLCTALHSLQVTAQVQFINPLISALLSACGKKFLYSKLLSNMNLKTKLCVIFLF